MPLVTLTTDFGLKDPTLGIVKGALHKALKDINIIDISNNVAPFHIAEAAYMLAQSIAAFPKGSIHIIGVDSEETPEKKHVLMVWKDQYFICANNGILTLLLNKEKPKALYEINVQGTYPKQFPELHVFVPVAAQLAKGVKPQSMGAAISITDLLQVNAFMPFVTNNSQINGVIIYSDQYGNLVTNITKSLFEEVQDNRKFEIHTNNVRFDTIFNSYADAINFKLPPNKREEEGKKLALWNSNNHLELAIYKSNLQTVGGAASLFGLKYLTPVSILFT